MTARKLLPCVGLVTMALCLPLREAGAVANGDGICSPSEAANFDCANFGTNKIEFRGAFLSTQCQVNNPGPLALCTLYFYLYTGIATNQLNIAIPTKLTKIVNEASEIHCSQYLTNGTGDPTSGFGKNLLTLGICRIANNLSNVPPDINPPNFSNFFIAVDPSAIDKTMPNSWQLKQGNSIFPGSIVGPTMPEAEVNEAAVTLKTPTGETVSYTNIGGNITITGGTARIVPLSGTKLCIVNPGGDPTVPYTSPAFPSNWTCETITFATEQCDIKTTNSDPCRFIGGTCVKYP